MSTRQATPGPSNVAALNTISMNSRKRGISQSEGLSDSVRKPKKSKGEDPRDKKRRRKKKRKISVTTAPGLSMSRSRSRSKSRTMTAEPNTPVIDTAELHPAVSLATAMDREEEEETLKMVEEGEASEGSSSQADKGKGKAKEESPPAQDQADSRTAEIERLRMELEAQKLLLQQHQSHFTQIQQSLSCEICLDLMHRPFALAPCGHVACHSCLVAWFTREEDDLRAMGLPRPRTHVHRRKTCPVCRTLIVQRPAEIWGLKSMVSSFQRSGLVEPPPTPFPVPGATTSTAASAPANADNENNNDPWHNIFRPARPERERDPFRPLSPAGGEGGVEEMGMYDAEDGGIYRCLDCMHEIWGNLCSNCGRIYDGHRPEEDDDDFDDEDDGSVGDIHPGLQNFFNALANGELDHDDDDDSDIEVEGVLNYWNAGEVSDPDEDEDEDEDDEDEDGYDGGPGFLFDDGMSVEYMGPPPPPPPASGAPRLGSHWLHEDSEDEDEDHPSAYIEEVDGSGEDRGDDEEEEDYEGSFIDDDDEGPPFDLRLIPAFRHDELSDEDSDGSSIYASVPVRSARARQEAVIVSDDDDDNEDEDEDEEVQYLGAARTAGSRFRLGQRRNGHSGPAVIISSDEEDDDSD